MSSKDIGRSLKRSALVLAMGVCFAGAVQAQSTTGNVFGSVPAGTTVTVRNASGLTRTVSVDSSGRYNISTLPVGRYTVTAERDGQVVGTREVTVLAGAASLVIGIFPSVLLIGFDCRAKCRKTPEGSTGIGGAGRKPGTAPGSHPSTIA